MKRVGLYYASETIKTAEAARLIGESVGTEYVELVEIDADLEPDITRYRNIIAGSATSSYGQLPEYWDPLIPVIEGSDLTGCRVALFGLGDQTAYPDNFADSLGELADIFRRAGATLVGFTPDTGYDFRSSKGAHNGMFTGLALDMDSEPEQSLVRIARWGEQLKGEFGLL